MNAVNERKQEDDTKKNQKQFRFPGVKKHFTTVKGYTTEINQLKDTIESTKKRLNSRIEEFRKQTGQKELYDSRDQIQEKIAELQKEKKRMFDEVNIARNELRELSQTVGEEKKMMNMQSTADLKNKLMSIDNRIIEKPLNVKEERDISNEKNQIRKMLSMQDIFKEKDEKIKEMEDQKKKKEAVLSVKKQELEIQNKLLLEVKEKIDAVKKTVYPEDIKKMQASVASINAEVAVLSKKRTDEFEIIKKKSEEFDLKAAEIEVAKSRKDALIEQEKLISDLQEDKEKMEMNLHGNPAEKLKCVKSSLSKYNIPAKSGKSQLITLPLHLVSQLVMFRIAIPKTVADVEKTLQKIDTVVKAEEESFLSKKEQLSIDIAAIAEKIQKEKETHKKMPRPVFPRLLE
ncbi:hypothetical protein NEAUS04_1083 [Nematocida ausubeli]|uniref:Uncharacterized protein n=1 Tax=Nematocida ausubeli (strain ATCC PRA-371 / ERTm2) TaxID=1913371 RepID=H8Z8X5_NEMA1|nr:uncharacterized protein NESG_01036 [Nematocida ausubeli]EHY66406.1 hypothetical protein NERG_00046 [Nematocida ausubeli]KAI5132312.1 hypothetical protein NEAUS07_0074 [Nematocida ausubeli]KAI5135662.1 hypothetical protein NEAUS06_1589 [Nematocida ausubeli]KAI5148411.1 hypothetical protein NEAUS05_1378 [Nematocida ausubeli]KAI5162638.1 hypothetical protein NEAUS04_1083 [Nematocida ausubeli]